MTSRLHRICVAVDASPASYAALGIALTLVAPGGELVLANAMSRAAMLAECTTPYGGDAAMALDVFSEEQRRLFADTLERCRAHGVHATTRDLDDGAAHGIGALLRDEPFDAVTIGTHARSGLVRFVLGSTAAAVVRASPVPVIVTAEHQHSRIENGLREVLVATDASESAQTAVTFATAFARDAGAHLDLTHVDERSNVAEAIVAEAGTRNADLIVVGTHGRSGLTLLRLGSVAARVLESAHVPVMVVPARANEKAAPFLTRLSVHEPGTSGG